MKKLSIFILISGAIIFSIVHFGMPLMAEKVMDEMFSEYITEDLVEEVLKFAEVNDVDLNIDKNSLPFQTKDQAMKVVLDELSVREITEIGNKLVNSNISEDTLNELIQSFSHRFSDEEIQAFKVIGISKLMEMKQSN